MSAEKTLDILDLFDFDATTLSVRQIAEKLNQPTSSVYRHLRTLKEKEYVVEMNDGNYKLGYRFLRMANIVKKDSSLATIARPIMTKLTEKTGETSILLVRSGMHSVCLENVPSFHRINVSAEQGAIFPLYGGASGKSLLAYLGDDVVDELFENNLIHKYTNNTTLNPTELKEQLATIRKNGFAFTDGEVDEGVAACGVPIFDGNNAIAALSLAGPRERLLLQKSSFWVEHLKEAAEKIQSHL